MVDILTRQSLNFPSFNVKASNVYSSPTKNDLSIQGCHDLWWMFWCSDQNFNKGFPYFLTKKAKEKGVESFDVSLETQIVQVESSTLSREEVYEIIKKSGKATEMLP